jgi:hypothetical protein
LFQVLSFLKCILMWNNCECCWQNCSTFDGQLTLVLAENVQKLCSLYLSNVALV